MKNEVVQKVDEYIQALADSLGVAASHVYEVLVRQQLAEGIAFVGIFILGIIIVISLTTFVFKNGGIRTYREKGVSTTFTYLETDYANITRLCLLIFSGFIFLVLLMITLTGGLQDAVLKIINPEYYAMKEILDVFKNN